MSTTLTAIAHPHYRRELADGLILRWSTANDIEDIAYLASSAFRDKADAPLNIKMANLMRELLSGNHPGRALAQGTLPIQPFMGYTTGIISSSRRTHYIQEVRTLEADVVG